MKETKLSLSPSEWSTYGGVEKMWLIAESVEKIIFSNTRIVNLPWRRLLVLIEKKKDYKYPFRYFNEYFAKIDSVQTEREEHQWTVQQYQMLN